MSFRFLGRVVSRTWVFILPAWVIACGVLTVIAPRWSDVTVDGEFAFLPPDSKSLIAEELLRSSFSKNFWGSTVMVVVRRDSRPDARLTTPGDVRANQTSDRAFVETVLFPRLQDLVEQRGWDKPSTGPNGEELAPLVAKISSAESDREIGDLLDSEDGQATLVRVTLSSEYMAQRNAPLIAAIENLIDPIRGELRVKGMIPPGLDLYLSGPAVVGKDMRDAAEESANSTEVATIVLVIGLLLLIYRAPLLALIPLATVFVGVKCALMTLSILANYDLVELFTGIEIYVTVVMYGAGVDYCMFLMSRYKEELDAGSTFDEAIALSLEKVGAAIICSAGTTIVGIGMMVFAEFGKFREAGVAMSLSLAIVLLATITFTPALLRLLGRWAFWPHIAKERLPESVGWISPTRIVIRILESQRWRRLWQHLADSIAKSPGTWWLLTVAIMFPLGVIGVLFHDHLTYGLLEELPTDTLSVRGAIAVQDHFPAGEAAPVTVLIDCANPVFGGSVTDRARALLHVRNLTQTLWEHRDELEIADIRSLADPHGIVRRGEKNFFERRSMNVLGHPYYVSDKGARANHITRLDIVLNRDPFSRESLEDLARLEKRLSDYLPEKLQASQSYFIGPTASIRDLKLVTNQDQIRIDLFVLTGVWLVLVLLLRQLAVSGYLILTVFFSYLVTLGVTIVFFWVISPGEFVGLDWKVPIFLFTILVAVGEDYNIYLVARIEEEQSRLGAVPGIREALTRTGGIISSCGIIMAGTFFSLIFGSLAGMQQLGFALAFGVILDTFVVRPILVPAYLVLLNNGSFGGFSSMLGAYKPPGRATEPRTRPPTERRTSRVSNP